MGFFKKFLREATRPLAHTPLRGVHQVAREIGRIGDQVVGAVAHDVGHLVENTVKESGKGVSKFVGELTGSRHKANQQADEQNQKRKAQVTAFLNSRTDEDIQRLEQELSDMLDAYEKEHEQAVQQGFNAAAVKGMYQQWRRAIVELEDNRVPAVNLEAILNGDEQLLKNFLIEGEFLGGYNPLTLAVEKFLAGNLNPQTMGTLMNRAFDRLSANSELFYLEPDARERTMAELLLQAVQAPQEIVNRLLDQAVQDACGAIDRREDNTLQKLLVLGRPLLDKPTMDGQTLFDKMRATGYEGLLADFQQPAPEAERRRRPGM